MPAPADIYELLRADLEAVGITVNPVALRWNPDYQETTRDGGCGIYLLGWTGDFNDAYNFLGTWFADYSREWGFENQELFDLLAEATVGGEVVSCEGAVGGGGAPGVALPGFAVALPESLAGRLRAQDPAVVARVEHGRTLVDLRCVPEEQDPAVLAAVRAALAAATPEPVPPGAAPAAVDGGDR